MNIKRIILLSGDESHRLMDDGYHVQINYRHQQLCKSKETARNETEREREREREKTEGERKGEKRGGSTCKFNYFRYMHVQTHNYMLTVCNRKQDKTGLLGCNIICTNK